MDRRTFLGSAAALTIATPAFARLNSWLEKNAADIRGGPDDELFWARIRKEFQLSSDFINLNNGRYHIMPAETQRRFAGHVADVNLLGPLYPQTKQQDDLNRVTSELADLLGCSSDELAITRNTTESLDTIISGYPWKVGDEAVMADTDYSAMLAMFRQTSQRHGIVNKIVTLPIDPRSDDEIVEAYANAITPRTRLLMICHINNLSGQIYPVRKVCDMAHRKGVEVMVDGAHAVAHFPFAIVDLGCDYYGSSLHKWLASPLGSGILWVKKEHISKIWPLLAGLEHRLNDIAHLNHLGTYPPHTVLAISDAIKFHNMIGAERKQQRLKYLQNYWRDRVKDLPNVKFLTPSDPARSCAIASFTMIGTISHDIAKTLLSKYKLLIASYNFPAFKGCRVVPSVYTTTSELDTLVRAVREIAGIRAFVGATT